MDNDILKLAVLVLAVFGFMVLMGVTSHRSYSASDYNITDSQW